MRKDKKGPKKDLEFDLHKIKNIKLSHDKNYNNILRNKNSKLKEITTNSSTITKASIKNKSIISRNLTNNNFSISLNSGKNYDNKKSRENRSLDTNKLNDFKNTAYIVLNEIENGLFSQENFSKKKNNINNHYKFFKTFNKSIDKQIHSLKGKTNPITVYVEDDYNNIHKNSEKESNKEIKDYNEKNHDFIKRKFKEIYDQKKIKWKKEDKLRELKKELDEKNIFEIENFLFEIQDKNILKKKKNKYNKYF